MRVSLTPTSVIDCSENSKCTATIIRDRSHQTYVVFFFLMVAFLYFFTLYQCLHLCWNVTWVYYMYLEYTGSSRDVLQNSSLVAVLKEDGSVIVDIQHFNVGGSRACFSVSSWAVIYRKKNTNTNKPSRLLPMEAQWLVKATGRLWVQIPGVPMIKTHNCSSFSLIFFPLCFCLICKLFLGKKHLPTD